MWSTETGKCYHTFKGHTAEIVCVTFNSSSTLVATGSMDTMGKIWDVETGVEMASLQVSIDHVLCCPGHVLFCPGHLLL